MSDEHQKIADMEPKTPCLGLPLPAYTLDIDLVRLRAAYEKIDKAAYRMDITAADAKDTAESAAALVAEATNTAQAAMAEARSKATAADVDAHNQTKDAHGATVTATAGRIAMRDEHGRLQVVCPEADQDAATKNYVDTAIADADTIPEAPQNTKIYGRGNGDWHACVGEAPLDGGLYMMRGRRWVRGDEPAELLMRIISHGSGECEIPDAYGDGLPFWGYFILRGGGGGGGGARTGSVLGGGGGEGEMIKIWTLCMPGMRMPFVIGTGGVGGGSGGYIGVAGKAGNSSTFAGLTAQGGGGGDPGNTNYGHGTGGIGGGNNYTATGIERKKGANGAGASGGGSQGGGLGNAGAYGCGGGGGDKAAGNIGGTGGDGCLEIWKV